MHEISKKARWGMHFPSDDINLITCSRSAVVEEKKNNEESTSEIEVQKGELSSEDGMQLEN